MITMKNRVIGLILFVSSLFTTNVFAEDTFWLGADISGTSQLEAFGVVLRNANGEPRENTALMKELGLNAVRYRVWVNPRGGFCSKEDVLQMALRAKTLGMPVMIDFHYSDWWADPGKQNIPEQWKNLSYKEMCKALALHTEETLRLLRDNGVDVRWVQVGNETTDGFLWEVGRASTNMRQYAGLTMAGYKAVKKVFKDAAVIIHLDAACDIQRYLRIFDGLRKYGARWDMIGVSVYPYWDIDAGLETDWRGTVRDFTRNVRLLARKYNCPLMVVETGVESAKPIEGEQIMRAIIDAAMNRCEGYCKGVFYWAPEAEGHYPLGAFSGGRPTQIMDAFSVKRE